jgi:hypothetical protein
MRRFYGVENVPFVVSLSNHEYTLRQAQGERGEDDFYDDEEDDEKEWCD